ncbi:MAG: hypothetical protein ACP5RO_06840, partial [Fervidicoccaceae archaeon]
QAELHPSIPMNLENIVRAPLLIYSRAPFFMMFRDFLRKTLHYALFIITRKILLPFEDQRFFLNGTC